MGKKLILNGVTLTDASAPRLANFDSLATQGSLLLIEPAHPANPWAAGVPANGTTLINVVENYALATIGSATPAHVRPVLLKPGNFGGSAGLLERSSKGGLHGISPQGGAAIVQSGPTIQFPTQIISYLLAHTDGVTSPHKFYASLWYELTRSPTTSYNNSTLFGINGNGQQSNSALFYLAPSSSTASLHSARPYNSFPSFEGGRIPTSSLGNKFVSLGSKFWHTTVSGVTQTPPISLPGDGTQTSVTGLLAGGGITFGSSALVTGVSTTGTTGSAVIDPTSGSGSKDKAASWKLYRFYLEDLTVSGRTYAEVDAMDNALYTQEVLTPGGRYYGDTQTSVSTIL